MVCSLESLESERGIMELNNVEQLIIWQIDYM